MGIGRGIVMEGGNQVKFQKTTRFELDWLGGVLNWAPVLAQVHPIIPNHLANKLDREYSNVYQITV